MLTLLPFNQVPTSVLCHLQCQLLYQFRAREFFDNVCNVQLSCVVFTLFKITQMAFNRGLEKLDTYAFGTQCYKLADSARTSHLATEIRFFQGKEEQLYCTKLSIQCTQRQFSPWQSPFLRAIDCGVTRKLAIPVLSASVGYTTGDGFKTWCNHPWSHPHSCI